MLGLLLAAVVVVLCLLATGYIAVRAQIPPRPKVQRFALELAAFAVGVAILDWTVTAFHLNIAPIGVSEGAVILAAYALLTILPALWRIRKP